MASGQGNWPDRIWLVRHGESEANLARTKASDEGRLYIGITGRDPDVKLSPLGHQQARAVGRWFARMSPDEKPNVVYVSPYRRTMDTMNEIVGEAGISCHDEDFLVDERLREREYGVLEGLTAAGIAHKLPDERARRRECGKFYYRPPGGESWADVILRLRSIVSTMQSLHKGERILIVCHSVVIQCFRYVLERMTEPELAEIDRCDVANCSVTSYMFNPETGRKGSLVLERAYFVAPLESGGAAVTAEPALQAATVEPEFR